jgi:hypothetical protein
MTASYNQLLKQLDSLIPFLALEHEAFFQVLQNNFQQWFPDSSENNFPATLENYKIQVAHGAFLLGYSYLEAYLSDILKEIYRSHPKMLPDAKKLEFKEILSKNTYDDILDLMIQRELDELFRKSLKDIGKYFQQDKLKLHQSDFDENVIEGALIRNCLLHNNSRADSRLAAATPRYKDGDPITLTISDVNQFGLVGRQLATKLDKEAYERHLSQE